MSMPGDKQLIEQALYELAERLQPVIDPKRMADDLEHPSATIDLFNGKAGIIVFYLRLSEYDAAFLPRALSAADVLLYHPAILQQPFFTLYTGATGLLYLCIQLYEATRNEEYLIRAQELVQSYQTGILEAVVQDDLISGHAGNLLVLTKLYAYNKQEELLVLIRQLADKLVAHARISSQGLRWGHLKRSYDCLTGMSHGASGIAHALMQVASYFDDEGLRWLAMQSWTYEMKYYDPQKRNWLDLRLTSTRLQEHDVMNWRLDDFRKYISDVNSWAHGAAGIGIARLHAWKATGEAHFAQECEWAIARCIHDIATLKRGDFTLCSGYAGMALFLLEAAAVLNRPELREAAGQLAISAINYYRDHRTYNSYIKDADNDPGLFSGLAGVGYMFASVLLPESMESVTALLIGTPKNDQPLYKPQELQRRLFHRYYGKTLTGLSDSFIVPSADINSLEQLLKTAGGEQERFMYEHSLTNVWKTYRGSWAYTQRAILLEKVNDHLQQEADSVLLDTVFKTVQGVEWCSTIHSMHPVTNEDERNTAGYHYIHYAHPDGVRTFPVGHFTVLLLTALEHSLPLQRLLTEVLHPKIDVQIAVLQQIVLTQIRILLQQRFITK